MGRLGHLERLALGRSPFLDAEIGSQVCPDARQDPDGRVPPFASGTQLYDAKGRPVNPATEERNQAMRNAQNAVLSLVGVVESRDALDRELEAAARDIHQNQAELLEAEQDRGEELGILTPILTSIVVWWPEKVLWRVQTGIFPARMTAVQVLRGEISRARSRGLVGLPAGLLRGLPVYVLYQALGTLCTAAIGQGIGRLQGILSRRPMSSRRFKQLNYYLVLAYDILRVAVDAAFLPLQYLAFTQSLGLTSGWLPLPYWRLLLPWCMPHVCSATWSPTFGTSALTRLTSPGALLLLRSFLERDFADRLPAVDPSSSTQLPPINSPRAAFERIRVAVRHDPLGRMFYGCCLVRDKVLRWLGWDLEYVAEIPDAARKYQNNHSLQQSSSLTHGIDDNTPTREHGDRNPRYRSTSLSHLPAQYIADRIEMFVAGLFMLPLDSLVMRAVTQSVLTSNLPKTIQAMEAVPHIYLPFGGGPFGSMARRGLGRAELHEAVSYANKLGLGFALNIATEIGVFFMVYGLCRWQGVRNFGWGRARRDRSVNVGDAVPVLPDGTRYREAAAGDLAAP